MKKYWFFLFLCCFYTALSGLVATAQPDSPTFLCVIDNDTEVTIKWANNHNCVGDFVETRIYESQLNVGPWVLAHSTSDPTEEEATIALNGFPYYYIEVECGSGISAPTPVLDTFDPLPPTVTQVSVVGGGTEISWLPSDSPQAYAYLLYRTNAQGLYDREDTIYIADLINPNNPFTIDNFSIPGEQSEEYAITTMDFCGDAGSPAAANPHATIFLTAEYDSCAMEVNLSWTPYKGWEDATSLTYTVFKGLPNLTQAHIQLDGNTFSYTYPIESDDPMPLALSIQAERDGGNQSNSNEVQLDTDLQPLPSFILGRNVTVSDDLTGNQVSLAWSIDPNGIGGDLYISRGRTLDDMSYIDELGPLNEPLSNTASDNAAEVDRGAYYYAIVAENDCGEKVSSDTMRTIFLDGQDNFNLTTGLSWNALEVPGADIQEYTLYRFENGQPLVLQTFGSGDDLSYIDNVEGLTPDDGQYCYYVTAKFSITLPNGTIQDFTSFSNRFCLSQTSRLFVPTAFSPNGVNKVFQPVILFPNYDDYEMKVFNRWGEILFETTNPDMGWDGYLDGKLAQQGVYAYYITMKSTNGNQLERKGTVLLLR